MNAAMSTSAKRVLLGWRHYHRRLGRDRFPGVLVLGYHGVRPDAAPEGAMPFAALHVRVSELEQHCRLIRQTCQPISLHTWRRALAGHGSLPPRPVLLTFDDGYRTVLTLARPVLTRYAIPAVVFVCTGPVGRGTLAWYDVASRASAERDVERRKRLPFEEWARLTETELAPSDPSDLAAPLSPSEIGELARAGFEIGSHTVDHPILALAGREEQRIQVLHSKIELERWTGRQVRAFAYPNGQPGRDYTAETVTIVRDAGYDMAFTTRAGFAVPDEPALERSRHLMLAGVSGSELAHRMSYSWRR